MSSFRASVVASYTSQIYIALVGIVMMPVYLRLMGAEAYGLVGFFTMLQAWFQLLDFGLSPTLARECARFKGGATDALTLRRLVRALEAIFVLLGTIAALGLAGGADWIALNWLKADSMTPAQVALSVQLMAAIVALRWMSGLYRGALGGLDQLVWLGAFNVGVATARFVLALRGTLGFSLSIAFTGAVWVAVTQTDKLILSKLLPLSDYAHFTLAVLLASGVTIVSGPLSAALLPRLSRLHAQSSDSEALALYRRATQGMALVAATLALVLAAAAEPVLFAWTGERLLAADTAPLLQLYALGNGVLALASFPYFLQFAKGDIRLHLIGNLIFLLVLVPSIVLATMRHGAVGAGWTWLVANLLYGMLWVPLVHRKFAPGLHLPWLGRDIAIILAPAALAAWMLTRWAPWPAERFATSVLVVLIGLGVLAAALPFSSLARDAWARQRSSRLAARSAAVE